MNSKKWDKRFIFIQPSVTSYKHFGIYLFVLIFFLLTTLGIKFFIIDILLIFRKLYKPHSSLKDGKIYDAYVIYPRESLQMSSGAKICHFVYTVLPNILERKCGYKLFIYGRDDVPGEDRAEIIEKNIKLSRRLILLLTPGPLSDEIPEEAYDTQVGLYRALVQEEMKVIVIELEKFDDYMHLPETLHHIIQKRKSLKWNGNESATSRFWKHVRYMMPRCTSSSRVK
ncbi:interleukin-1 receptor-like 2 [Amia ocellicauda]|uniref:interleukin-1 receptor-like 2 n=1 Tax=Amia ocellicauda TaxID=2972642 RepID=UPI003464706E